MEATVSVFRKSNFEEVRAVFHEYKDRQYVSLRVFYEDQEGEQRATHKGLTISIDLLPELVEAVYRLKKVAIQDGLVEAEEFEKNEGGATRG